MPFNKADIYTSSGSVQLFNEWVPYVSKFDTSSFYNWEQDNLPLYDLEERTYELWEQNGYNTSAGVPGLALTVSADAANTVEGIAAQLANRNIFTELSSCIAAIPKVVRFPVLVEVGSFGDLGDLELHNFRIEEGGSIEIINRNFARMYDTSAESQTGLIPTGNNNSSHRLIYEVSSIDTSNALTDTSCVHLGVKCVSSAGDPRAAANTNRVAHPRHSLRSAPLAVAVNQNGISTGSPTANLFKAVIPYEQAVATSFDATQATIDASAQNQATAVNMYRTGIVNDSQGAGGSVYHNKLGKITVKNCDGPIFIRNFFVDAAKDSGTTLNAAVINDYGIEVTNSDVLLENCAAIRAKEAGWKFNNSKVVLSRSAFAYRNYKLTSTTTREAETGYGFHAVNSDVSISSLPLGRDFEGYGDNGASATDCKIVASRNYAGFVLDNSKLTGGIQRSVASVADRASVLSTELNTGYGMLLDNAKVDVKGLIDVYGNDKGIQADNTKFTFENLCIDAHSNEAIRCRNSEFIFDSPDGPTAGGQTDKAQLDMSGNSQHLDLQGNSIFSFRRKNNIPSKYGNSRFRTAHGVIKWNSANNCTLPAISVKDGSILDLVHAQIDVSGISENIASRPSYGRAIQATNSSKASLFGSKTGCTYVIGPAGISFQQNMAGLYGSNNSTINLHGPTAVGQFGVDALVEDNSVLNIEPARKRDEFGLEVSGFDLSSGENHTAVELHATRACLVANRNSTINMADLGAFPINWGRTATGQGYIDAGIDYPIDTYQTSAYTSSGCLQFYPNPQDTSAIDFYDLDDLATGAGFGAGDYPAFVQKTGLLRFFATQNIINTPLVNSNIENFTQGGMCVRATEDSVVNVKNVHFPVGTNDSPLDGFFYTTSGSLCDKLMIWNMADTSRLNASFTSVSGTHPVSTQYHGPSALWASSFEGTSTNDVIASGAPSGTPGTGALSVLDAFGAGSSVWVVPQGVDVNSSFNRFYPAIVPSALPDDTAIALANAGIHPSGNTTYKFGAGPHASKNQGVFRIYWTPKPSARALQVDLSGYYKGSYLMHKGNFSGVLGPAYQLFAQGYNCSADLSAVPILDGATNIVSSTYPDILRLSYDSDGDGIPDQLHPSGFYYCADMLDSNPTQCILDESAARTFANAQNASINIAGTPVKVTLVRSRSDGNRLSEAYVGDASGSLGFKSASIFDLSRDN